MTAAKTKPAAKPLRVPAVAEPQGIELGRAPSTTDTPRAAIMASLDLLTEYRSCESCTWPLRSVGHDGWEHVHTGLFRCPTGDGWATPVDDDDIEARVQEAYEDGERIGSESGFEDGKAEGLDEGEEIGYTKGRAEGYEDGHHDGREEGYRLGLAEGRRQMNAELNGAITAAVHRARQAARRSPKGLTVEQLLDAMHEAWIGVEV